MVEIEILLHWFKSSFFWYELSERWKVERQGSGKWTDQIHSRGKNLKHLD